MHGRGAGARRAAGAARGAAYSHGRRGRRPPSVPRPVDRWRSDRRRRGAAGRMVPPGRTAAAGVRQSPQGVAALDAGSAGPRRRLGTTIARKSIVTKTGDGGETGLLYGGRVAKTDPRTEAYGAVDEAISTLGTARALVKDRARHAIILRVQSELFTVGAELATDAAEYHKLEQHFMIVTTDFTGRIERES